VRTIRKKDIVTVALDDVGFFYTREMTVGTISAILLSGYSGPLVSIEEALLPFASLL
jgi:hypothetical protein